MDTQPRRMTLQRTVILDTLQEMRSHPTADELYRAVQQQLPNVSLGTIYRNLDVLARSGHVRKLETGGMQARFDAELAPHHHVRCQACGRVDDVPIAGDTKIRLPDQSAHGFRITGHRVEFVGLCPDCESGSDSFQQAVHETTDRKR